jgi:SM-20-related protein
VAAPTPPSAVTHSLLLDRGVAVRDGFVAPAAVRELIDCARARRDRGDFAAARIGGAAARLRRRADVRGDSTCWLEEPLFEAERRLHADIEALRQELNREAFLGLSDLEWHYACYPPGTGYARHVDQLLGRDTRRVSLILYLNQRWQPGDGGELRMFDATGHRDIEPVAGRLVCFLSEGREHEVLPTAVERWSIAGWLRCRPAASR